MPAPAKHKVDETALSGLVFQAFNSFVQNNLYYQHLALLYITPKIHKLYMDPNDLDGAKYEDSNSLYSNIYLNKCNRECGEKLIDHSYCGSYT